MNKQKLLAKKHQRRHFNIRKRCIGSAERPRLSVFRSNRYIYAQVIDDSSGKTIASCSSLEKGVKEENQGGNKKAAEMVGKTLAERAKKAGVEQVSFDRGGFKYHGRIKALADGARSGGLSF